MQWCTRHALRSCTCVAGVLRASAPHRNRGWASVCDSGRASERGCASPWSHGQLRNTCPIQTHMWNTHVYTTETIHAARANVHPLTHTHICIHLRHTHTCVELENQRALLVKHTHMCTPGTHICVHLRHASKCVHVEHTCVHLEHKTLATKAHMCVHVGHTYVYHWNTNMCPETPRVRSKHTCVHTWNTICARVSKHKCSPKAHTHTHAGDSKTIMHFFGTYMCTPGEQMCRQMQKMLK